MDARFWIVVVLVWLVVLANVLVSLLPLPSAAWARVRYWRIWRVVQPVALVLLATSLTLSFLARDRRWMWILDASSDAFVLVEFTLIGLSILLNFGAIFLLMARYPEVARMLHVPPRLYAWLYNRDINESSQAVSSTQLLPGDH